MNSEPIEQLIGLTALKRWLLANLPLIEALSPLRPRAIVVVGLAGSGKHSVVQAIADSLGWPLRDEAEGKPYAPKTVLLIEDLDRTHQSLVRRVAAQEELPFIVALSERPWEVPVGLLRPDAFDSIWHLDLPDAIARAEFFDLAGHRLGHSNPAFDPVVIARIAHDFLPAEIFAAYRKAIRNSSRNEPVDRWLLSAVDEIRRFVDLRSRDTCLMAAWTKSLRLSA